ncbi:MAG: serine/threonine-protein kinase [Mycobacterium sp.]
MSIGVPGVSSAEKIGQGGFGIVYRAHQDSFDRTVAVKVLSAVDLNAEAHERFAREVRAVGRLSGHPNIVSVYEHGTTTSGAPYLLMEYCERGSYGDVLRNGQRLSWERAVDVGICIAEALEATHQGGLLHRDVKPDNILIDRFGKPKLADFGIAKNPAQGGLTMTGSFIGSPQYIAPEIVLGQAPSPASDLYALAASMYALITGEAPYVRDTDTSLVPLLHRITSENPPTLHHRDVPGPIADAVLRGMAKEPAHRPASCAAFAEELRRAKQLGDAANATRSAPAGPGFGAAQPGGTTPPGGTSGPGGVFQSGPHIPAAHYQSGPMPAAQKRTSRLVPILLVIGGVVFLLGLIGVLVVVLTGSSDQAANTAPPSARSGGAGAGASQTPETTSANAAPQNSLSDEEAADALRLTADQADTLGGPQWLPAPNSNAVNASAGFCGEQLPAGPTQFSQLLFTPTGEETIPSLGTAGAVFGSAETAASYQRQRNASAACGTWVTGANSSAVFEPPIAPNLVGCECQDVAVHEIVLTAGDGSQVSQYTVLAQQDRYIAAAFYTVPGTVDDAGVTFVGNLIDAVVAQVNQIATDGQG